MGLIQLHSAELWIRRLVVGIDDGRLRSQASPRGICGGRSGNEKYFSPSTSIVPSIASFHQSKIIYYQRSITFAIDVVK